VPCCWCLPNLGSNRGRMLRGHKFSHSVYSVWFFVSVLLQVSVALALRRMAIVVGKRMRDGRRA
jgi:hypothetical protein